MGKRMADVYVASIDFHPLAKISFHKEELSDA